MKYRVGLTEMGLVLVVVSVFIGGYYFVFGNGSQNTHYQQTVVVEKRLTPTSLPRILPTRKISENQPVPAGTCVSLPADPALKERYRKLTGKECGFLDPIDFDNERQLSKIRDCLNNALKSCQPAKAYVFMQGFEGITEYVLSTSKTDGCVINVERWGTVDPYCGNIEFTCKEISKDFPSEMCDGK